jgi:arginine deiminase
METSLKKEARRRSELDVEPVAKEIEEQKGTAGEDGRRKKRRTNGINVPYAQAAELLDDSCYSGQVHENDLAEVVVVCEPGLPKMMGALHPAAALYERFVNIQQSILEHAKFREVLRKKGIKVLTVREILHYGLDNLRCRIDLEGLAMEMLRYKDGSSAKGDEGLDGNGDNKDLPAEENAIGFNVQDLVGDDYKRKVLENMSPDQLIDVILTNPTVTVKPSFRDTGVSASYEFEPLTNLIFTRDQQITTAKGIVMASLRSQQRQHEIKIMKFCFQKLGIQVIAEVERPGYLEGGDFFPAGSDLCFCGVGLRSNENAVQQLMEKDAFGTKRVAIVKDLFDKNQDRMHLDCVFSILSESCVLMLEEMMGKESPTRRLVDEYAVDLKGNYTYSRKDVEFSQYLKENGFKIIPVTAAEQLKYACNVVNLGSSCILSCHAPTARKICQSPHFSGTMEYVDYSAITAMYGALHCSTQIVKRKVQ